MKLLPGRLDSRVRTGCLGVKPFYFLGFHKLNTVQKLQKGTVIKYIHKHVDKVPDDSTKQAKTPLNSTKSKQILYSETNLCLNC